MGFHNLLTGQDLHEPSRVRIVNDSSVAFGIGELVKIGGPVVAGVTSVTDLAVEGDTLVAFIDSFIPVGSEYTAVLFGRILNIPILNPSTDDIVTGDFVKVGSNSRFTKADSIEERVGTVLRRTSGGEVMDVLFSPFASRGGGPQVIALNTADFTDPLALTIPTGTDGTSVLSAREDYLIRFTNNASSFSLETSNDSLELEIDAMTDLPTGLIRVKQSGLYEISVPDYINFLYNILLTESITLNVNNRLIMNVVCKINNEGLEVLSGNVFDVMYSSTIPTPQQVVNINGSFTGKLASTDLFTADGYARIPASPKLINLEANDTIGLYFQLRYSSDAGSAFDRTITATYSIPSMASPAVNIALTVKRI